MKMLSLNVEGDKHLGVVKEFVRREKADIALFMEVFEDRKTDFVQDIYPYTAYAPNMILDQNEHKIIPGNRKFGVMIVSKYKLANVKLFYPDKRHNFENLPVYDGKDVRHAPVVLFADVVVGNEIYRVGTTHFTWTPNGSVSEEQKKDISSLLGYLSNMGEFVLAGDFNIPRGNESYMMIAKKYKDNVPEDISTTIDPELHYANKEESGRVSIVVDHMFSTPKYEVGGMRVECGVSDHCALISEIERV